ncbi:MAG: chromosome segregation protein SMC [Nanoarchaeota archaeon]|nr:chromosome segregation protein SMC [Nanoarchaeota archaeon]MBU1270113.1 chromosome segregation protein SMC [Nanoarchaeota archaeon]MBU1604474.1 chromosome segregation protein SMC [Nanoarchaeota archaeon]MBU2443112.1 chromosome segregation protein SMC [Nanoarchaeota archaeon]
MTRILKLEMKGFKSFAFKTEIPFGNKFNVILGPNGCGKSNVLDALCFVLGKSSAKSLRAEKSANLIYNGGKSKNPAKKAEVSIYFDNSKKIFPLNTPSVKLTRTIKPSGQSKYEINDETRTRQQILDFLSIANIDPGGYNIILQGDITHLVEMSTIERRGIIEEIAGISVYESKKEKALRELSRIEQKLNEAEIILAERKGFLRELKKEKDQALKFKELDINIKRNRATTLNKQITDKKTRQTEFEKAIDKNTKEINTIQKAVDEFKKKISQKKEEIGKINKEVEEKGEKEQIELNRNIEHMKVALALNKQRVETVTQELQKINNRKKELEENKKELQRKITAAEQNKKDAEKTINQKDSELKKIDAKIDEFKKKNNLGNAQELDKQVEEIDSKAEGIQGEINKLREEQQNLFREKDKYEILLQNIDAKIDKVLSVEKENKEGIAKLKNDKNKFKAATTELNTGLEDEASISAQLDNARSKLLLRREELSRLNIRSSGLKEQIAGDRAIKEILHSPITGIHGLVSQLGTVSTNYSLALGIAAGGRIKNIVVDSDAIASECIKYLREKRFGTATFLPLNKLKPQLINTEIRTLKGPGIIGLAIDLVKFEPEYERVFQYVFGNTLVVDNLDVARKIGVGKVRMVTKTGDLVETSGAMQGGYREKSAVMSFAEEEVSRQIKILESEIRDLESVIGKLEKKKKDNDQRISILRSEKAELESEILKAEKTLHIESGDFDATKEEKKKISTEIKVLEEKTQKITSNISKKNVELANFKSGKQELRDQITALRNPALLAEMNTFEQKKQELKEELSDLRGDVKNADSELTNILKPEKDNIDKILTQQLIKEKDNFEAEKKRLDEEIKTQTKNLSDKEKKQKEFYSQYTGLFNQRSKLEKEISASENTTNNKSEEIRRIENKNNALSLERAKLIGELEGLEEEFKKYKDVELFKNKSEEDIAKEIQQFERMVQELGAVNMKALELYEKAEKDYDSLMVKKDKLSSERQDILVMINEIDSKKKDLFMKTFDVINKNFQKIFLTLSTKGRAYIHLENPKDPFEAGVEIKVKLTTKKFMDIRSLSGGEKTMTALAFLFAVQEHEPASFYILDEVDASLDKKNSEKLAELITEYSKRAQYVIISHNDGIITHAENLFGVSMNHQQGISKVTSLKI